jgi:hypothetical protein
MIVIITNCGLHFEYTYFFSCSSIDKTYRHYDIRIPLSQFYKGGCIEVPEQVGEDAHAAALSD